MNLPSNAIRLAGLTAVVILFLQGEQSFASTLPALAATEPGTLKAEFVFPDKLNGHPIAKVCKAKASRAAIGAFATEVFVGIAGKVTESLIDAVAAKTQPEVTTLEAVVPLDGLYGPKEVAVDEGCLVFHNGNKPDASDASIKGILQLQVSEDTTAFRLKVIEWKFDRFLRPKPGRAAQREGVRDFAFKIEFLAPGVEGIGSRKVFMERAFFSTSAESIHAAYFADGLMPWMSAPEKPENMEDLSLPLNVRVTIVETTKPNQFAVWLQNIATEKKADISMAVQDAVRATLDPNYAASEAAKLAQSAGTAYVAYKQSWDVWAAEVANKPTLPPNPSPSQVAAHDAALKVWNANVAVNARLTESKRVIARAAFDAASLAWPGDFPAPTE